MMGCGGWFPVVCEGQQPLSLPQPGDQVADTDGLAQQRAAYLVADGFEPVYHLTQDGLFCDGKRIDRPAELKPPPEHTDKPYHWLMQPMACGDQRPVPFEWDGAQWLSGCGSVAIRHSPDDLRHYCYLGPAEWRPPTRSGTRLATDQEMVALQTHLMGRIAELEAAGQAIESDFNALREVNENLLRNIDRMRDYNAAVTAERDALRIELAQRKAMPANALRHSR